MSTAHSLTHARVLAACAGARLHLVDDATLVELLADPHSQPVLVRTLTCCLPNVIELRFDAAGALTALSSGVDQYRLPSPVLVMGDGQGVGVRLASVVNAVGGALEAEIAKQVQAKPGPTLDALWATA